ncbi:MAG: hypothetical protein M3Q14_04770 [bacterium]|nr:hypothetical protein [bacterium]
MRSRKSLCLFALLFMLSNVFALLPVHKASAETYQASFSNRRVIKIAAFSLEQSDLGRVNDDLRDLSLDDLNSLIQAQVVGDYIDANIEDNTNEYTKESNDCRSRIRRNSSNDYEFAEISIIVPGRGCKDITGGSNWSLPDLDQTNATLWFVWKAKNALTRVDGAGGDFLVEIASQPKTFFRSDERGSSHQDFVVVDPNDDTLGQATIGIDNADDKVFPVKIGGVENKDKPPVDTRSPDATQDGNSCESRADLLGWILCPVIRIMDSALSYLDEQIMRLLNIDKNKYDNPGLKQVWQQIRNIAYIILIPVMLVMVIGTAIGVEAFSAYTVKRALPRMVVAVIFITLSWYITTFMINFFNVVGGGVLGIMTTPFSAALDNKTISTLSLADLYDVGFSGLVASATLAVGVYIILTLFLSTFLLIFITVFGILLLRQLFIVVLMLVAPLAILAWIFPGNDRFWKTWWGAFTKLLMMYPIILAVLAIGRIFAVIIMQNNEGHIDDFIRPFLGVFAYVLPYAFIPFTFKLAGGLFANLTGMVNDRQKGLFDRARQTRAQKLERGGRRVLQTRAEAARALQSRGGKSNFLGRSVYGKLARTAGGYNVEAAASARNANVSKELNDQIATGRDEAIRGLTVNKKAANRTSAVQQNADGKWDETALRGALVRQGLDGTREYKSLGGAWVNEAYVDEGQNRWGKDHFAQQTALSYEMRKAMTSDQVGDISSRYGDLAKSEWKMTDTEAAGAWIGAGFENQNQHLEFKNTSWNGQIDANKFATEAYEKKGSYQLSQMSAHTIEQLGSAYDKDTEHYLGKDASGDKLTMATANPTQIAAAQARRDDTRAKVKGVAETFMSRYGAGAGDMIDDGTGTMVPVPTAAAGKASAGRQPFQTMSQGAGHVAEQVRELAVKTGVYADLDPTTYTHSGSPSTAGGQGTAPPTGADHDRQN